MMINLNYNLDLKNYNFIIYCKKAKEIAPLKRTSERKMNQDLRTLN